MRKQISIAKFNKLTFVTIAFEAVIVILTLCMSVYLILCYSLQHAFQIDALILKDLLNKYIPVVSQFLDVSISPIKTCTTVISTRLYWPHYLVY